MSLLIREGRREAAVHLVLEWRRGPQRLKRLPLAVRRQSGRSPLPAKAAVRRAERPSARHRRLRHRRRNRQAAREQQTEETLEAFIAENTAELYRCVAIYPVMVSNVEGRGGCWLKAPLFSLDPGLMPHSSSPLVNGTSSIGAPSTSPVPFCL